MHVFKGELVQGPVQLLNKEDCEASENPLKTIYERSIALYFNYTLEIREFSLIGATCEFARSYALESQCKFSNYLSTSDLYRDINLVPDGIYFLNLQTAPRELHANHDHYNYKVLATKKTNDCGTVTWQYCVDEKGALGAAPSPERSAHLTAHLLYKHMTKQS